MIQLVFDDGLARLKSPSYINNHAIRIKLVPWPIANAGCWKKVDGGGRMEDTGRRWKERLKELDDVCTPFPREDISDAFQGFRLGCSAGLTTMRPEG